MPFACWAREKKFFTWLGHLMMEVSSEKSLEVFFCYAYQNEDMRNQLEKHLSIMQRQGLIIAWHDSKISAGLEWEREANVHLNKAHIILLLISPDFMNSDYCYSNQMKRALDRHEKREAIVIPVLLRSVDLEGTPLEQLKALPTNGKFVTRWRSRDDAFTNISKGIRNAIKGSSANNFQKRGKYGRIRG
jgi:TIR domain